MKKTFTLFCCILICVLLISCQTTSTEDVPSVAVDEILLEAFFKSQPEAEDILALEDTDKRTSSGIDEYVITATWCGKELETVLSFSDKQPITFSANETLIEDEKAGDNIHHNLILFENQLLPKSIDIIMNRESGEGKTVEYNTTNTAEAIQNFCETETPCLIRFKFQIPGKEESRTQVEYTVKKGPDTLNKTEANYSIVYYLERNPG